MAHAAASRRTLRQNETYAWQLPAHLEQVDCIMRLQAQRSRPGAVLAPPQKWAKKVRLIRAFVMVLPRMLRDKRSSVSAYFTCRTRSVCCQRVTRQRLRSEHSWSLHCPAGRAALQTRHLVLCLPAGCSCKTGTPAASAPTR